MKSSKIISVSGIVHWDNGIAYRSVKVERPDASVTWENVPELLLKQLGVTVPERTGYNHAEFYPAGRVAPKQFNGKSIE